MDKFIGSLLILVGLYMGSDHINYMINYIINLLK